MTTATATKTPLPWAEDDGGRAAAGYKGSTRDCVTRAAAIATGTDYATVYKMMHQAGNRHGQKSAARTGVPYQAAGEIMRDHFHWKYISYATGPVRHLTREDMPALPILIASLKRDHWCAIIDGTVRDTWCAVDRFNNGRLSRVAGIWIPSK